MAFYEQLLQQTSAQRDTLLNLPVIRQTLAGEVTRTRYLGFLEQAYHHVRHTVPLMMSCGGRLGETHPWLLPALQEYIEEEIGHEQWILNDIDAAGGDAAAVRAGGPDYYTELMVAYAYDSIARHHPLSFFGMVLVLEGTSTALATQAAGIIQQRLALPEGAFSYLNSHGELDLEHVQYFARLMDQLDEPAEQQAIVHAARRFYRLYGDVLNNLPE